MSDVTNVEEGSKVLPEGAIGTVESDPTNPELKTGEINFRFHLSSDGIVFIDHNRALAHEENLRAARTGM